MAMNVNEKFVRELEKSADSVQFNPVVIASWFSRVDPRTQTMWIGLIAETIFYIQSQPEDDHIHKNIKEFVNTLAAADFSDQYAVRIWR